MTGIGIALYNGGDRLAMEAALAGPNGLACADDDTLFIADTNRRVRLVDPAAGRMRTVVSEGGEYCFDGAEEMSSFSPSRPVGVAVEREDNVLITDSDNHRMPEPDGRCNRTTSGKGKSSLWGRWGLAVEAALTIRLASWSITEGRL